MLRERYEQAHGIYNHVGAKDDHFGLVKHHWAEDTISASRLRERLEAFIEFGAGRALNMSFTEFIDQPSYLCDLQLEILEKRPNTNQELEDALNQLNKSKK